MGNPSIKFSCFNVLLVLIKEEQLKAYKAGRKGFTAAYIPFIAVFLIIIFFSKCNPTEPENRLEISIEDVSCTEAWIKVTGETGRELILNRDNKEVQRFTLTSSPQTIYDDSLKPNKAYTYQAVQNNKASSKITVTTLDTTSSNFIFQTFYFGGATSSSLSDIAIINDTLAYAVGQIYVYDSSGLADQTPYCIANWNGSKWRLSRLKFFPPQAIGDSMNAVGTAIFANNKDDIWLAAGAVFHYDGKYWNAYYNTLNAEGANKIWSDGKGRTWFVGNNGLIVYYFNNVWQKLESGTTLDIYDVYGAGGQIIAIASSYTTSRKERKLLRIDPTTNTVTEIYDEGLAVSLRSIWFVPNKLYLCGGDGLFYKKDLNPTNDWEMYPVGPVTNYYTDGISGNDVNDIFVSGAYMELLHFNGMSWHNYKDEIPTENGAIKVVVKGNLLIAVGLSATGQAITIVGKR